MRVWDIPTHSGSIYRVTMRDDGSWHFGAVDIPSQGVGTRFLGASYRIEAPTTWPPEPGRRLWLWAHDSERDRFPASDGFLLTSTVEQVADVTPAPAGEA